MRLLFLWLLTIGLLYGGSREALLVGNSDYDYISDLKNPKSSMKKLKKTLEDLGFRVKTAYNLDAEHLSVEVEQFRDRLRSDSIGFFYYSGHGCQLNHQRVEIHKGTKHAKSS